MKGKSMEGLQASGQTAKSAGLGNINEVKQLIIVRVKNGYTITPYFNQGVKVALTLNAMLDEVTKYFEDMENTTV